MDWDAFKRTEVTTTTLEAPVPNVGYLRIKIENTTPDPVWYVYLIDYDDNIGAVGEFLSEAGALYNMDKFIELAVAAYAAKHAKYGKMPVIKFVDGELKCIVPEKADWEVAIEEEYRENQGGMDGI